MGSQENRSKVKRIWVALGGITGFVAIVALILQGTDIFSGNKVDSTRNAIVLDQRELLATLVVLESQNPKNSDEIAQIKSTIIVQDNLIATLQGTPVALEQKNEEAESEVASIEISTIDEISTSSTERPPVTETHMPAATSTPTSTSVPTSTSTSTSTPSPTNTATSTPTPLPPAFSDDFEGNIDSQWSKISGEWIINNGELLAQECGTLILGNEQWNNYSLGFYFNNPASSNSGRSQTIQIAFGYNMVEEYIVINITSGKSSSSITNPSRRYGRLRWEIIDGESNERVDTIENSEANYDYSESHQIYFEVRGNSINILLDGEPVYGSGFFFPEPLSGVIGLSMCPGNSADAAVIDNFVVNPLLEE